MLRRKPLLLKRAQSHPSLVRKRKAINQLVVMGDSISDRGTMNKRHLLGFIPMHLILALTAHNHNGRFTNGFTWNDDLGAMMASGFLAQHFKKHKLMLDDTDIADAVITNDPAITDEIKQAYDLTNDHAINYKDSNFIRTYCEGGLTSADYRDQHVANVPLEASRHMLSTLELQRNKVLADDKKEKITRAVKAKTLVIEWSGGNDLITVNVKPTNAEADKAVQARIDNVEQMIALGYRQFALFTLPDFSLTPRFKAKSEAERAEAKAVSDYFNAQLSLHAAELQTKHKEIELDIFDVNQTLRKVIENPSEYGFDNDKAAAPFVNSDIYKKHKSGPLAAPGYIFWDDIHPTAHTHSILAKEFYEQYEKKYEFSSPNTDRLVKTTPALMYEKFMHHYAQKLEADKKGLFGFFRKGRLMSDLAKLAQTNSLDGSDEAYTNYLVQVFNHALTGGGKRSKAVLIHLGWLDKKNRINSNVEELNSVKQILQAGPPDQHALARIGSSSKLRSG